MVYYVYSKGNKKKEKDVSIMANLLTSTPLSKEVPAFDFTTEEQLNMVLEVMEEREIFMSAENFNNLAWELLG